MENSMTEKLRPEQRKLWRRNYLTAFDDGANVNEAASCADRAVAHWEARGAFEAEALLPNSLAWHVVTETLQGEFPDAFKAISDALTSAEAKQRALVADAPA